MAKRETTNTGLNEATTKPGKRSSTSRRLRASGASIDAYLAALPVDQFGALQTIRKAAREIAPGLTEDVRYKVPTLFHRGVPLVGFSATKQHLSFFVMSHKVMETFKKELAPFYVGPGILRFSPLKPIPAWLVKKIVEARVKETEALPP